MAMSENHYPNKDQLAGLNRLLTFLSDNEIYWFEIKVKGDIIVVKTEPPKGDFEIRVFKVGIDGRVDDDGFREILQGLD